jgi:hypothetical protein
MVDAVPNRAVGPTAPLATDVSPPHGRGRHGTRAAAPTLIRHRDGRESPVTKRLWTEAAVAIIGWDSGRTERAFL